MEQKFFRCSHCGNIIAFVKNTGVPVMCCGQKMEEIVAGSVDASKEKHLPVFTIEDNKVYVFVGDVEHPMTDEHHIEWISLQTAQGNQRKVIAPGEKPATCFNICNGDKVEAVYAYCNLHGLWKSEYKVEPVCDLKPVQPNSNENYLVCKCNNVTYFDIIKAVGNATDMTNLLKVFDSVKNTTHCSQGCGGCYGRVISIISDELNSK